MVGTPRTPPRRRTPREVLTRPRDGRAAKVVLVLTPDEVTAVEFLVAQASVEVGSTSGSRFSRIVQWRTDRSRCQFPSRPGRDGRRTGGFTGYPVTGLCQLCALGVVHSRRVCGRLQRTGLRSTTRSVRSAGSGGWRSPTRCRAMSVGAWPRPGLPRFVGITLRRWPGTPWAVTWATPADCGTSPERMCRVATINSTSARTSSHEPGSPLGERDRRGRTARRVTT